MWTWEDTAIVCALLAGAGALIDRMLLNRHKPRVQQLLVEWWDWLDRFSVPDLPKKAAGNFLKFVRIISGRKLLSIRGITFAAFISLSLTTIAMFGGRALDVGLYQGWSNFVSMFLPNTPVVVSAYFPNLLFDLLTISVTVLIVKKIHRLGVFRSTAWILLDISLAGIFAIACVNVSLGMIDVIGLKQSPEIMINFNAWYAGMLALIWPGHLSADVSLITHALYSATTFIPTVGFLLLLIFLTLAKSIARIGIIASQYLFEKASEGEADKVIAFTMLRSLFAFVGLLAKTVHHFVT